MRPLVRVQYRPPLLIDRPHVPRPRSAEFRVRGWPNVPRPRSAAFSASAVGRSPPRYDPGSWYLLRSAEFRPDTIRDRGTCSEGQNSAQIRSGIVQSAATGRKAHGIHTDLVDLSTVASNGGCSLGSRIGGAAPNTRAVRIWGSAGSTARRPPGASLAASRVPGHGSAGSTRAGHGPGITTTRAG